MAENKKGFLLYADQKELFDQLPNDKAGELIKHIFSYVNDESPETEDLIIKMAFTPIKQQFKRDLLKWEDTIGKRSKAGKASAEARKLKKQQSSTKSTHVKSVQQDSTQSTVSVNVNVNDSVNDSVNVNDNVNDNVNGIVSVNDSVIDIEKVNYLMSEIKISDVPLHQIDNFKISKAFFDLIEKNLESINAPTVNLKKQKVSDWVKTIRLMIDNGEANTEQLTAVWKFLQKSEFWKPNIQSPKKLREKFTMLYAQSKKKDEPNNKKRGYDRSNFTEEGLNKIIHRRANKA